MQSWAEATLGKQVWPPEQPPAELARGAQIVSTLDGTEAGLLTVTPHATDTGLRGDAPRLLCGPTSVIPSASQPPVTREVIVSAAQPAPVLNVSWPCVHGFDAVTPQLQSHVALAEVGGDATRTGVS